MEAPRARAARGAPFAPIGKLATAAPAKRPGKRAAGVGGLTPAEQALDIGKLEFNVGRSAVIALAGMGRQLHFAQ
jgi:hypothetical protein